MKLDSIQQAAEELFDKHRERGGAFLHEMPGCVQRVVRDAAARIAELEAALGKAETTLEMMRVVVLGSLPGCRPFDDAAAALKQLSLLSPEPPTPPAAKP